MLDENELLSPYGIRSLSKFHERNPFVFFVQGQQGSRVDYLPAESNTGMFGGNSNWRGPVWMPVNAMEVAKEISDRRTRIFVRDERGRRAVYGGAQKFQTDSHWRDHILFYEYFHGDNEAGLGASHQTGWTGVVAKLIQLFGMLDSTKLLEAGKSAAFTPRELGR